MMIISNKRAQPWQVSLHVSTVELSVIQRVVIFQHPMEPEKSPTSSAAKGGLFV
jgi:hypothetical protein